LDAGKRRLKAGCSREWLLHRAAESQLYEIVAGYGVLREMYYSGAGDERVS
jgi:hypothetical protein